MADELAGKVAVITGGTSGIGLASVEAFVDAGARVVVGSLRAELGAQLTARLGDRVAFLHADVNRADDIEALVHHAVERYGKLDVMFNNAGTGGDTSSILDIEPDGFDATLALLTRSVLLGHKYAARQFIDQGTGGSIITTASQAAIQGGWSTVAYTAAKHAVIGIVRQAAAEFAGLGIRANAILPGPVMTPIMARSFGIPPEHTTTFVDFLATRTASMQPAGRVGRAEEVAAAAVFLAGDGSRWIHGVALPVDGGSLAVSGWRFGATATVAASDFLANLPA